MLRTCLTLFFDEDTLKMPTVLSPCCSKCLMHMRTMGGTLGKAGTPGNRRGSPPPPPPLAATEASGDKRASSKAAVTPAEEDACARREIFVRDMLWSTTFYNWKKPASGLRKLGVDHWHLPLQSDFRRIRRIVSATRPTTTFGLKRSGIVCIRVNERRNER